MPEDLGGEGHGQAPIIKRIKKVEGGHHGGAWKIALADMTTALMALFIVLWILAQSDQIKQNVAGYFRDPVGFEEGGVPSLMEGGAEKATGGVLETDIPKSSEGEGKQKWRDRARQIRRALEAAPAFEKYGDQIELAVTSEGLRISLIESLDTPLFRVGSVDLNPDASEFLETLGNEIQELDNHIVLEGHTDSRPFASGSTMNNWELSTGRAHTARGVLVAAGIAPSRFHAVRGFSDRQLYNPLDPEDSRNRRVSITLLSAEAYRKQRLPVNAEVLN